MPETHSKGLRHLPSYVYLSSLCCQSMFNLRLDEGNIKTFIACTCPHNRKSVCFVCGNPMYEYIFPE